MTSYHYDANALIAKLRPKVGDIVDSQLYKGVAERVTIVKVDTEDNEFPYCVKSGAGHTYWLRGDEIFRVVESAAVPAAVPNEPQAPQKLEAAAAVKHAKPRVSLLFSMGEALLAVAEVLTDGAKKYADDSWKREPFTLADYLDADGRHTLAIGAGELRDPESGRLHAAHKACDSLMYLWHVIRVHGR